MVVLGAWHPLYFPEGPSPVLAVHQDGEGTSHGICPPCVARAMRGEEQGTREGGPAGAEERAPPPAG